MRFLLVKWLRTAKWPLYYRIRNLLGVKLHHSDCSWTHAVKTLQTAAERLSDFALSMGVVIIHPTHHSLRIGTHFTTILTYLLHWYSFYRPNPPPPTHPAPLTHSLRIGTHLTTILTYLLHWYSFYHVVLTGLGKDQSWVLDGCVPGLVTDSQVVGHDLHTWVLVSFHLSLSSLDLFISSRSSS